MTLQRPLLGPWSFYRSALKLAAPVMLQAFLLNAVSLVDNFMVAGLGDGPMAGVNIANQLTFVYLIALGTIAGAGGIFISQYHGARKHHGMQQAFRFKLLFSMALSLLWFGLCQLMPETLITIMTQGNQDQAALILHGAAYLRAVSWSFLLTGFVSASASAFRDIGQPNAPLVFSVIAALVNTGLNWLLIEGNLGLPRLEVSGAAIATDIARGIEVLLLVWWLARRKPTFGFAPRALFHLDWVITAQIIRRSWMMLVSELTWVLSETVTSAIYNGRGGADLVAGLAAGWTVANLFFSVFGGLHVATGVLVGSSLGAGELDTARQRASWILRGSWIIGTVFALGQGLSLLLVPLVFPNLSPAARSITTDLVIVIGLYLPLWVFINAQFAVARSGGDTWMGFILDVGVTVLLFLPMVFGLAAWTPWNAVQLFAVVKLTDFVKTIIAHFWLKKERWVRNMTGDATGES